MAPDSAARPPDIAPPQYFSPTYHRRRPATSILYGSGEPDERVPEVLLAGVRNPLHSMFDQADPESVGAQYDHMLDALIGNYRYTQYIWTRPIKKSAFRKELLKQSAPIR
ncbi:hypothetical protein GFY24_36595 [Nocardia sp. SYP-A9097]|nr:hypothetical protein [Nocardia sp. SYP-A9097]